MFQIQLAHAVPTPQIGMAVVSFLLLFIISGLMYLVRKLL
jgi:hypothetical protein